MNVQVDPSATSSLWKSLGIAGIVVFAIWLLSWLIIDYSIVDITERGTFGDKFGAVNALFSGLAFAGLIVTLLYQKEELKLQRAELSETRRELNAQRLEFQEQNKTMRRQRFENTFFNMLSLHQEIIANLSVEYYAHPQICPKNVPDDVFYKGAPKCKLKGREVFEDIFTHAIIEYAGKRYMNGIQGLIQTFGPDVYSSLSVTTRFDHPFRHLYNILKFVDTSDLISDVERNVYADIVRSQLSDHELLMLFYHCISNKGQENFTPLIEKYTIFHNLRDGQLVSVDHKYKFAISAFLQQTK